MQVKPRIAGVVAMAGALLLGPGGAVAPAAPPTQRPVAWTLTAAQCPNLPTGTTLTGTGTLREVQGGRVSVEAAGEVYVATYAQTFADVKPGELLVYQDAYRTLALAINRGDAAGTLRLELDAEVRLQPQ